MNSSFEPGSEPPVIPLASAPGERSAWDRPTVVVLLWSVCELLFIYNPWQVSSRVRAIVLRLFGAEVGRGVIVRPRTRIRFPWKLAIGENCWIGEGVWIHNQDRVTIGHDAVISQEVFITTGSHDHRRDMGLLTRPVIIEPGVWVTSRCVVLGGVTIGRSSLIGPLTVVDRDVPPNKIVRGASATVVSDRFPQDDEDNG